MVEEITPLTPEQRERSLGIALSLTSGFNVKTENSKAVNRHLSKFNFDYSKPITIIFYDAANKLEDRIDVTGEKELYTALKNGPLSDELRRGIYKLDLAQ